MASALAFQSMMTSPRAAVARRTLASNVATGATDLIFMDEVLPSITAQNRGSIAHIFGARCREEAMKFR
jgi:hypothetical protein